MGDPLYYEIHVTIEPDFDRVDLAQDIAGRYHFRMANLLMRKDDKFQQAQDDMFFSSRTNSLADSVQRTILFCRAMKTASFDVRRYKIETAIIDSKMGDHLCLKGLAHVN